MIQALRVVLVVLALLAGARAQAQEPAQGHGAAKPTMQMENSEFFTKQFEHITPHHISAPLGFYNVNLYQLIALALILVLFAPVKHSFAAGARAHVVTRVLRGWVHWIRDEMVYAVMGKDEGRKFAPYFVYLFFFIALMNVVGLLPTIGVTATATPFVTGALALCTFLMMVVGGMREQGVLGFFKNLLPHGLPKPLLPLMALVELLGLFIKPIALTIRLFANMLAGHLVIASFIGLVFLFAKMMNMSFLAYATALPALAMAVFIFVLEAFITLLQAYIFTYLSIIFVKLALHPEH